MNQMNTTRRREIKQRRTRRRTTNHPLRWWNHRKKLRYMWKITYLDWNREKKMKRGDFRSRIDPKPSLQWKIWKKKPRKRKLHHETFCTHTNQYKTTEKIDLLDLEFFCEAISIVSLTCRKFKRLPCDYKPHNVLSISLLRDFSIKKKVLTLYLLHRIFFK